jgi:hypothetical protein
MKRALGFLIAGVVLVTALPLLAAENAAPALDRQGQVQAPPNSSPGVATNPETPLPVPDFLKSLRFTSDCPTPLECISICQGQGCACTDGCDGMGGCLCSMCS